MNEDAELLRRFARDGSQEAFAELVRRTVNFVYAAALRQTGGDAHLAQDVTQGVYLALARNAAQVQRHAVPTGWLYTTTRFLAVKAVRAQARWQRREQEANTMNELARDPEPAWENLRPVIDEAMHELGDADRTALLLRFFEGRPLAEVGSAIGVAENAARMRVERALEKLRTRLARRGITSTAVALGVALANQPVVTAPAGFAGLALETSLTPATVRLTAARYFLMSTKIKFVVLCIFVALGVGTFLLKKRAGVATRPAETPPQGRSIAALREKDRDSNEGGMRPDAERATRPSAFRMSPAPTRRSTPTMADEQRRAVLENLRLIAEARDQFFLENRRLPAGIADLVGPDKYIKRLDRVDGEDYGRLEFGDGNFFSATTAGGIEVSYELGVPGTASERKGTFTVYPAPPADLQEATRRAAETFRLAHDGKPAFKPYDLLPYFENPKVAADYVDWMQKTVGVDLLKKK